MRVLALILTALLAVQPVNHTYTTETLEMLGRVTAPVIGPDILSGTVSAGSYRGNPLVARLVDGAVDHLGIELFDNNIKSGREGHIYEFVERYLLELISTPSYRREERMEQDGVLISGDLDSAGTLPSRTSRFTSAVTSSGRYSFLWEDTYGRIIFSMSVPARAELIFGRNKIELEDSFRQKAVSHVNGGFGTDASPQNEPIRLSRKVYIDHRGSYMSDAMRNALFYEKSRSGWTLISDDDLPMETVTNLLMAPAEFPDRDYRLDVTLMKYGFEKERFYIPLVKLMDFCICEGCVPYVGIESEDKGQIRVSVIMVNRELGYNHVLDFMFDRNLLKAKIGMIPVTLRAYTTTGNLSDLYNDDKTDKETRIKLQ